MTIRQYIIPRNAFLLSSMMIATGLGCSNILMSWGEIGLVIAFFWGGNYSSKLKNFIRDKRLVLLTCIYLMFVFALIHTSNFNYAFHDLKVKLPILLTPFFLSAFFPLSKKEFRIIFHSLYIGALITMIAGTFMYFNIIQLKMIDMRSYSPFIAHLRVGTLLVFLIFFSIFFYTKKELRMLPGIFYLAFPLFAIIFLLLIQSLTGFAALIGTMVTLVIQGLLKKETRRSSILTLIVLIVISSIVYQLIDTEHKRVYNIEKINYSELPRSTNRGTLYKHDTINKETVNGHYIFINIAPWELQQAWDKRSQVEYHGVTKKGWPLWGTLIKYLASKGEKKNAESVNALSGKEVKAIEKGVDNYLNVNALDIRYRFNQLWVEIYKYEKTGDPNYMSFATRLETWKVARYTISKSPIIGFGVGDVKDEMIKSYRETGSQLLPKLQLNPHQQYFTVAITMGITGLVIFLLILFFPLVKFRSLHPLFLICLSIIAIGMFDEDMIETQAGATQFIFMYVLTYLFQLSQNKPAKE